jgi:PDZ domain
VQALGDKYPAYFVWGPLVFSPATTALVMGLDGQLPGDSPLTTRRSAAAAFPGEELVVVVAMLPHRLSKGYGDPAGQVVRAVNGTPVRNLRHLVETLRDAKGPFVEIEFHERSAETLVFDRREVLAATEDILSDNNIGKRCSDDLRKAWPSGK